MHFNFIAKEIKKFQTPSPLKTYFEEELRKVITSQNLKENRLIMADKELSEIVNIYG